MATMSHVAKVSFLDGQNELPTVEVNTPWSNAEIYLHGAHITRFRLHDETPLLFMSQCSRFEHGQPIRGGIPVIFPWFGMREGLGQHGFARTRPWDLREVLPSQDGKVRLRFELPPCPEAALIPPFSANYIVTVSQTLEAELIVKNEAREEMIFEECLHTYFEVGDSTAIFIKGLSGTEFLVRSPEVRRNKDTDPQIRINSEIDRIYLNTTAAVEIIDPRLGRKIHVEKENSLSTVVWNPWIEKSQRMPDFGDDEYQRMVCVESGNVAENQVKLAPGQTSRMKLRLTSTPLT